MAELPPISEDQTQTPYNGLTQSRHRHPAPAHPIRPGRYHRHPLCHYLITFINHGTKEIDKTDPNLDEIIPENVTEDIETHSDVEKIPAEDIALMEWR